MWKSAKVLLLVCLVAWPLMPDSLTDKAPAAIGTAWRHSIQTIGAINTWDNHDWAGAISIFVASILALRKFLFWRPTKIRTVIEEKVINYQPDGISSGPVNVPPTLEELLEDRIKRDIRSVVSMVREAIVSGSDKVEEIEVGMPSKGPVIGALKKQLPGMDFKWVNSEDYEDSVDLTWTPAPGGPSAPF
jgi:hypothetical protein